MTEVDIGKENGRGGCGGRRNTGSGICERKREEDCMGEWEDEEEAVEKED